MYVKEISSGSLWEDVIVKLFFEDQAKLDAFLAKIRAHMGDHPVTRNVLLGSIVAMIVGYGIYSAGKAMGAGAEAMRAISVNNNTIINIGAAEAGMKPEALEKIVIAAITDKKANAKDAVELVKPAKRDDEAGITFNGNDSLVIPVNVVRATPSNLTMDALPSEQSYPDVDLHIRATNLDSHKSGWAGLIPGLVNRRVKLALADGLDAKRIVGKFSLRADVVVSFRPAGQKHEMTAYRITVQRLIEE